MKKLFVLVLTLLMSAASFADTVSFIHKYNDTMDEEIMVYNVEPITLEQAERTEHVISSYLYDPRAHILWFWDVNGRRFVYYQIKRLTIVKGD